MGYTRVLEYFIDEYSEIANKYIVELQKLQDKRGRKQKQTNMQYLRHILVTLIRGKSWNDLNSEFKTYSVNITGDAVRMFFTKWNKLGVFKSAFDEILTIYKKKRRIRSLFTDTADILNFTGVELVGFSYKFKSKKAIRFSVLVDKHNAPICYYIAKPGKNANDCQLLEPTIEASKIVKIKNNKNPTSITADAGYTVNGLIKSLKKDNILLNAVNKRLPKKCKLCKPNKMCTKCTNITNQPKKTRRERLLAKQRCGVEHFFTHLFRTCKRVSKIIDKKKETLFGWFDIACAMHILKIQNKLNAD
jgi:hypothetical protein